MFNSKGVLADYLKLLSDPRVMHALSSVVGKSDANIVFNTGVIAGKSTQMEANALFNSGKTLDKILGQ